MCLYDWSSEHTTPQFRNWKSNFKHLFSQTMWMSLQDTLTKRLFPVRFTVLYIRRRSSPRIILITSVFFWQICFIQVKLCWSKMKYSIYQYRNVMFESYIQKCFKEKGFSCTLWRNNKDWNNYKKITRQLTK